jgi:hypothetical protein
MLEPWHLPDLGEPGEWWEGTTAAGAAFRAPVLDGAEAEALAAAVRKAALEARDGRTTADVIRAVAGAAERMTGDGPAGVATRELLRTELGWNDGLARETLDGMARAWTEPALTELVETEVGGAEVLDGFAEDQRWTGPGRRLRRAAGPPIVLQVLAGNVPGVAVTATVRALVARSGVLCKVAGSEPGLVSAFARLLAAEDPLLGRTIAATWWPGGEFPAAWREWSRWAGRFVVYGGRDAVESVRRSVPAGADLVVYGPKTGVGVILPDADASVPASLAADVCAYDQQGCVSPRLVYVVGASARAFAHGFARALDVETRNHPPPEPTDEEAVAIRSARADVEFGGYGGADSVVEAPGDALTWTVLASESPDIKTEALPRVVRVHAVSDLPELFAVLQPLAGQIQSLGYGGVDGSLSLAEGAARLGISRVAPLGTVAWPPVDWRHEGRHQLLPLLNWTDFETRV